MEKILESEEQQEQIEGMSQTEKVERVRRLSEGLDDEAKEDSIEEPKLVKRKHHVVLWCDFSQHRHL